jgi:hypothetical protein
VAFVREFVASAQSGNRLPPPISFCGPDILFNGRQLSHQSLAQQMQSAFAKFPRHTLHIISGPTVVGPSQDQAGSMVRYEIKFVFSNWQKRLEGKAAVQLTVETQDD